MQKITVTVAVSIVETVRQQMKAEPTYRMGQGIYNLLTKHIPSEAIIEVPKHYLWYNSLDVGWCIRYFYDNFVDLYGEQK